MRFQNILCILWVLCPINQICMIIFFFILFKHGQSSGWLSFSHQIVADNPKIISIHLQNQNIFIYIYMCQCKMVGTHFNQIGYILCIQLIFPNIDPSFSTPNAPKLAEPIETTIRCLCITPYLHWRWEWTINEDERIKCYHVTHYFGTFTLKLQFLSHAK